MSFYTHPGLSYSVEMGFMVKPISRIRLENMAAMLELYAN